MNRVGHTCPLHPVVHERLRTESRTTDAAHPGDSQGHSPARPAVKLRSTVESGSHPLDRHHAASPLRLRTADPRESLNRPIDATGIGQCRGEPSARLLRSNRDIRRSR